MDNDRIAGTAKETVGKAEAAIGETIGDTHTEASGRIRQATGAAKDLYGQAKDAAQDKLSDAFEDLGGSAEQALDSLEREVRARPLVALLIAALIGFVLAQLTSR